MDVSHTLQQLQSLPRLGDDRAEELIDRLQGLASEGLANAERLSDRDLQIRWLQACHGISRRVAVWKPVWQLASQNTNSIKEFEFAIARKPEGSHSVHKAIDNVRAMLSESGDAAGWDRYLMLNRIAEAADSDDTQQKAEVARQFLSRLHRTGLHPLHQQWLRRDAIDSLRIALQPWGQGVVDYAELLSRIERQESDSTENAASEIAEMMRALRFASNPSAVDVADSIDTHYRNANLRVAISQSMLQRLVPDLPSQSVPVSMEMMGSRIRGSSNIDSDLQISLVPSPDRWSLQLHSEGSIETRAIGNRGPVSVRTQGRSAYTTITPIELTPYQIEIGKSVVSVRGRTRLRGIQTDYDGWPLVGSLIRGAAESRFKSLSSKSSELSNRKIAAEIESRIDNQLSQRVGKATERLGQTVLGPLNQMQLDPTTTDMQTTDGRLVARYRLAGHSQLAAYTPRPRALHESLLSVQVHQSAINNALEQLAPTEQPISIRDAISNAINNFGQNQLAIPDDIPDDVTVQFARTRPITAEFDNDTVWITLRVVRLQRGDRLNLTKFIVRAAYRPQVDGIQAQLVREGHLRISGPGMSMRERLPIRAIFNKVLSPNRALPLTIAALTDQQAMDGLAVSQLEIRDGWIAVSIGEAQPDRVASAR